MISTDNTRYSYLPGCSLTATNRAYDLSTRGVASALGINLVELDDWNCCGATAYMAINERRSFVLSARNLALAKQEDCDLVTVCNGCYLVLRKTNKYMAEDVALQAEIQQALAAGGMHYDGGVQVRHFLDVVVSDLGESAIRKAVLRPLTGLKVAPYYGCQIGRPFGEIDDEEDPQMMDKLIEWLGGTVVPFPLKAKCCGGTMMITEPPIGRELTGRVLQNAKDVGADCIITACPLCQINLEPFQDKVGETVGTDCNMHVLYFTQLMGIALGLNSRDMALRDAFTPIESMLAEKVQNYERY